MLTFLNKYAKNIKYSQNGEEGILIEIFNRIKPDTFQACEFGAHNGRYCSNTRLLHEELYFSCLMIENDIDLFNELVLYITQGIVAKKAMVLPENVNELLKILNENFDLLSIDTDGDNDYDCFHALNKYPKVVIIEINSGIKPDVKGRKDAYHDMVQLGIRKGYFLLCHTGNLVFIKQEYRKLFPEVIGNGIDNSNEYFNTSWI